MYKLSFFVPPSHVDVVKNAVFAAGGGRIGNYDHCAWQTLGQGQLRSSTATRMKRPLMKCGVWLISSCNAYKKPAEPVTVSGFFVMCVAWG